MRNLVFCLALLALTGCPKREEIRAEMWLQSGLPEELCTRVPEVRQYGMYRRLNDEACKQAGKPVPCWEIMRYCNAQAESYLAIQKDRFNDLLDAYLPKGK